MYFLLLGHVCSEKVNKSGAVSIQVLTKFNGKSKLVKTIGSAINAEAIESFVNEGY